MYPNICNYFVISRKLTILRPSKERQQKLSVDGQFLVHFSSPKKVIILLVAFSSKVDGFSRICC